MSAKSKQLNIVAIIQARMGSTRLPGKVMKAIAGRPMLDIQLERVKRCNLISSIVVATTANNTDDIIAEYCSAHNITCYRGDESNVLKRYFEASQEQKADIVVRLTSDCPLIDPIIIDQVVRFYLEHQYEFVSNVHPRTFPRGMDVEVFSAASLAAAYKNAITPYDLEHVTPYILKISTIGNVTRSTDLSRIRLTVDTPEDFEVFRQIFIALYPHNPMFTLDDIMTFMDANPSIAAINAHIEQKKE